MLEKTYLEYLSQSAELYPLTIKKHLIKTFVAQGIATSESNTMDQLRLDETIDISGKPIKLQFSACLQNSSAFRLIEKWEFEKKYKYSILLSCDNFSDVLEKAKQVPSAINSLENVHLSNTANYSSFENPISYITDTYTFLKFNRFFQVSYPASEQTIMVKYPFLVVFHEEEKIIEFRFDQLNSAFSFGKKPYDNFIREIIAFFADNFHCALTPMDLSDMTDIFRFDPSVKVTSQFMHLPSGGKAQLDVGNDSEYGLPFIHQLNNILTTHASALEKVPELKKDLEDFKFEIEELSDYPWIELLWDHETKNKINRIKLTFFYMNNSCTLIQHYSNDGLIGMERMNHVVKYIVSHRNNNSQRL